MGIKGLKLPSVYVYIYFLFAMAFYLLGFYPVKFVRDGCKCKLQINKNLLKYFIYTAFVLQIFNFYYLGGIPLFSGHLKSKAVNLFWFFSYLLFLPSINILFAKFYNKKYFIFLILGVVLFSLTGYRTPVVVIILSVLMTLYYTKKIPVEYSLVGILIIFFIISILGYVVVKFIEWQHWTLNPIQLLLYRAGYTLLVVEKATKLQGITHGLLFYYTLVGFFTSVDPRAIVGLKVLGYHHSTTSTIIGPPLLDFGIGGMLIQMFLLGFILKFLHNLQLKEKGLITAFYSIMMSHALTWIETGPTDLVVWILYFFGIVFALKCLKRCKK
ncbi:Protein of unknown function DUF70 [Methanothermus fervidus DSM 2088]|uniref:Oligosaccharide repeat unit polymerase n=1 Tax=Methanothermus fervidus (strain ATCC 43054 / DSM 2088 / JCM 10308 / V24 S) TaxID=523846 RepID=E3GZB0_METFV|nr:Protein of unknown function DUF70 [Methanothermus fervidus DSM 2088]